MIYVTKELALQVAWDHNRRNTPGPVCADVVPAPGGWEIRDRPTCQRCRREPIRFRAPALDHPDAPPAGVAICGICRLGLQRLLGVHGYAREIIPGTGSD